MGSEPERSSAGAKADPSPHHQLSLLSQALQRRGSGGGGGGGSDQERAARHEDECAGVPGETRDVLASESQDRNVNVHVDEDLEEETASDPSVLFTTDYDTTKPGVLTPEDQAINHTTRHAHT